MDDHLGVGYTEGHTLFTDCNVSSFGLLLRPVFMFSSLRVVSNMWAVLQARDCVRSGRDKVLDDALFGFFMKQVIYLLGNIYLVFIMHFLLY